jgi:hypothetical protein
LNTTAADEVVRLRAAELEAEQRYLEAIINSDSSAARNAAEKWINAADAFTAYVAKNPNPYAD